MSCCRSLLRTCAEAATWLWLASHRVAFVIATGAALGGCGESPAVPLPGPAEVAAVPGPRPVTAAGQASAKSPAAPPIEDASAKQPAMERRPPAEQRRRAERGALEELLKAGRAAQFELPALDEQRIAAAGIRKLTGRQIVLYTDLPPAPDVDELPQVFDAAVPLWCAYFNVDPATVAEWRLVGSVMQEKEPFVAAGLYTAKLPDFPNGFNRGSELWLYEQKSPYYRRHLLLHEGTHAFMERWLGNAGPPWYAEGMAELLGTHRWARGQLTLGIMPATKEELPYWGRVKIIKEEFAAARAMSLIDILQYDNRAHFKLEAYGWCWAAAYFFDQHPLTQAAFRDLKRHAKDISLDFSQRFFERIKEHWPAIAEDWQVFVADCDYGYDVPRAAVIRQDALELPAAGATVKVTANRGWQSTGFRLTAGKTYALSASGRFQIGATPKPWPCEAGGVTIRYAGGQPLGMLLAALSDLEGDPPLVTPLASPQPIGLAAAIEPTTTGTLYLKINEPAAGLADNSGELMVTIRQRE